MTFRNCQIEIDDNGQIIGGSLDRVFKNGKGKTFFFFSSFFSHDIIFFFFVLIAYTSLCTKGFKNLITDHFFPALFASDILL